jgi:hypothetical protein
MVSREEALPLRLLQPLSETPGAKRQKQRDFSWSPPMSRDCAAAAQPISIALPFKVVRMSAAPPGRESLGAASGLV